MSGLNYRDYNLVLELSIPESIPCTKREDWFPINNIDVPKIEVARDIVGVFPNLSQGRDLSKGVEKGYKPKFYDYYSIPRVVKKGVYKIHCSMFIKTEEDMEIKQCLETWLKHNNISVPSIIKVDFMDNSHFTSEEIKCAKTFISDFKEDLMCSEKYFMCCDKYIDFTFFCEDMTVENG